MDSLLGYALKGLAALVALGIVMNLAILLMFTKIGIMTLFVTAFVAVRAVASGSTLLATGFLYPKAATFASFSDLLLLIGVASLASVVLFDLGLEGLVLRTIRHLGAGVPQAWMATAFVEALVTASMLLLVVNLVPGTVGLSVGAALVAGAVSAFVRYYLELYLSSIGDPIEEASYVEEADR